MNKRLVGSMKEDIAAEYLKNKGYFIIEKNYHVRQAEIDIVARDGNMLVFVEVKYRSNETKGHPLEAVNYNKQIQVCRGAMFYLNHKNISVDNTSIRFDVIGILGNDLTHVVNAFDFVI